MCECLALLVIIPFMKMEPPYVEFKDWFAASGLWMKMQDA